MTVPYTIFILHHVICGLSSYHIILCSYIMDMYTCRILHCMYYTEVHDTILRHMICNTFGVAYIPAHRYTYYALSEWEREKERSREGRREGGKEKGGLFRQQN